MRTKGLLQKREGGLTPYGSSGATSKYKDKMRGSLRICSAAANLGQKLQHAQGVM